MPTSANKAIVKIVLFSLFFLPVTFSLGVWQLDRAEHKTQLLEQLNSRKSMPELTWQNDLKQQDIAFRKVVLKGRYSEYDFLLDNRIRQSKVGYEVLTLFFTNTGDTILVNRGWLPAGHYRDTLPVIDRPKSEIVLRGYFYQADAPVPVLRETPMEGEWPIRIQRIVWDEVMAVAKLPIEMRQEFRLQDDTEPGALLTGWKATSILPEKHLGYAYQWFGLFLVLLIMSCYASGYIYKRSKNNDKARYV